MPGNPTEHRPRIPVAKILGEGRDSATDDVIPILGPFSDRDDYDRCIASILMMQEGA
jgi:hypothetical protein